MRTHTTPHRVPRTRPFMWAAGGSGAQRAVLPPRERGCPWRCPGPGRGARPALCLLRPLAFANTSLLQPLSKPKTRCHVRLLREVAHLVPPGFPTSPGLSLAPMRDRRPGRTSAGTVATPHVPLLPVSLPGRRPRRTLQLLPGRFPSPAGRCGRDLARLEMPQSRPDRRGSQFTSLFIFLLSVLSPHLCAMCKLSPISFSIKIL